MQLTGIINSVVHNSVWLMELLRSEYGLWFMWQKLSSDITVHYTNHYCVMKKNLMTNAFVIF
jgi:hypothetical protein